jgi:RNA polymerase sigma-70 factor (ECF subfamily)
LIDSRWQDKVLIMQFNRGDKEALRRMYARYRKDLVTLATTLLFDKNQGEDIVHEVFAKLVQNRERIKITSSLRGYLFRAVANKARNANRFVRDKDSVTMTELGMTPSPTEQIVQAESFEALISALKQLPYEQREVLLLRHYGNLRFKAIAKCQGVSIATVQGRYNYGLQKLRSLLKGEL